MPMVRVYLSPKFTDQISHLQYACEEIVPAGLNSKKGPLTPGSIEFIPTAVEQGLTIDVVVDIEAYKYKDRHKTIEQRTARMRRAFNQLFPGYTFAVFSKLVTAGWSSDTQDSTFDGDMSMKAAIERYEQRLVRIALDEN